MSFDVIEEWRTILEFPNYEISSLGQVYNSKHRHMMSISFTTFGHSKITLTDEAGQRHTRSVALLVAEAFVEPPNILCDAVVVLDGDFSNLNAANLVWRPQWFAWKYTRQLKSCQPLQYQNLRVENVITGVRYQCIIDAGIAEGLLFDDIWRSTYTKAPVFPSGSVFEIIERV